MSAPQPQDPLNPQFEIWIGGKELPPEARADLISVRVEEALDTTGMFEFTLSCWDVASTSVKWIDDSLFEQGNPVDIRIGYRDELESIFVGEVTGLEPQFASQQASILIVRGYDRRHRMMGKRRSRTFQNMKDSDIAAQIAGDWSLKPEVTDTRVRLEYVLQHNQTDFEFLQARAHRIGFESFVSGDRLSFRPRPTESAASLRLTRESGLLDFCARSSSVGQFASVQVQGWSPQSKREVSSRSAAGDERRVGATRGAARALEGTEALAVRSPVGSQAEADQLAQAWLDEMALQYIVGDGECVGRADLRPGVVVEIAGLGRRFSGDYYVTQARHTLRPASGYRTAFSARKNSTP